MTTEVNIYNPATQTHDVIFTLTHDNLREADRAKLVAAVAQRCNLDKDSVQQMLASLQISDNGGTALINVPPQTRVSYDVDMVTKRTMVQYGANTSLHFDRSTQVQFDGPNHKTLFNLKFSRSK